MLPLLRNSSELLKQMYDDASGMFSYSTRIVDNTYVNDFSNVPKAYRFTLNCLSGINRAMKSNPDDVVWDYNRVLEHFVALHRDDAPTEADRAFFLFTLVESGHDEQHRLFDEVRRIAESEHLLKKLNVQDAAWVTLGMLRYFEAHGSAEAEAASRYAYNVLTSSFLDKRAMLPAFDCESFGRRNFTSFGGISYFLWMLYEYGRVFSDQSALDLFAQGTRSIIALQGPQGEWPWFVNLRSICVADWYQIYSVHQNAMAPFFLLPAADLGIEGATEAITKSYRWIFGENELGATMISQSPYFNYRSIRRRESLERPKRLLRSFWLDFVHKSAHHAGKQHLVINTECRSYEIGWILFAWAGREDFREFTELRLLPS